MQGLSDTWYEDAGDVDCNSTELMMASDGHFRATRSNLRSDSVPTILNLVGFVFHVLYFVIKTCSKCFALGFLCNYVLLKCDMIDSIHIFDVSVS